MPDVDIKSDLMVGVMNLIEIESHAQFNYWMTGEVKWLELKGKVAEIRQRQMADLEKKEDNQLHCQNKHTLSAIFRSWEVGDKHWRNGDKEKAIKYYEESKKLLEIFYNLNFQEEKQSFLNKAKDLLKNVQR